MIAALSVEWQLDPLSLLRLADEEPDLLATIVAYINGKKRR